MSVPARSKAMAAVWRSTWGETVLPRSVEHVTVHTLRHSAAMRLLLAGVDITVIALWLGHF